MQQLRTAYFSNEEIAGLFSASDAYDLDAIARLEISSDTSLTATQRQQRLAELDARLPQQVRAERKHRPACCGWRKPSRSARTRRRRQRGLPHAPPRCHRPPPRLADLDREEADWQRASAPTNHNAANCCKAPPARPASNCATAASHRRTKTPACL
jgi:hypothetical protein